MSEDDSKVLQSSDDWTHRNVHARSTARTRALKVNRANLGRESFCRLIRHLVRVSLKSLKEVLLTVIYRLITMPGPEEPITKVVVHPIVLLSVVDHFYRMGKVGNQKRVVGVLLGSRRKGVLDVANSFAGENLISYCST